MFHELWLLVSGLVGSVKTLLWVGLLLTGVVYASAIFLTSEVGHHPGYEREVSYDGSTWQVKEYFGTVPRSMLTLWQITTLDSW